MGVIIKYTQEQNYVLEGTLGDCNWKYLDAFLMWEFNVLQLN